ncbi:MAG: hypothetical protein LBS21_06100 [Clostridiales bacterium]|jgi:NADH/NAD ratio-sensing transcriptional regulator Rex|nr:hypothetical protein [Clostridiales bacterium]
MNPLFKINEDIYNFTDVIIYGSGKAGVGILYKLFQRNIKVLCFVDSNPDNISGKIFNVPVKHIDELADKYETAAFIIGGRYMQEISSSLIKKGIKHLFFDYANEMTGVLHLGGEDYSI